MKNSLKILYLGSNTRIMYFPSVFLWVRLHANHAGCISTSEYDRIVPMSLADQGQKLWMFNGYHSQPQAYQLETARQV